MKRLNKEQLILLADRLIDDAGKKDPVLYPRNKFTGGAVLTAFHYGKITYKVDLYFGYGKSKNPIHCKMNISEDIAYHVFNALNERCKRSIKEDTYSVDLLDDIVTASLRSSTTPFKDKTGYEEEKEVDKEAETVLLQKSHMDHLNNIYGAISQRDIPEIFEVIKKIPDPAEFGRIAKELHSQAVKPFVPGALRLCQNVFAEINKPEVDFSKPF